MAKKGEARRRKPITPSSSSSSTTTTSCDSETEDLRHTPPKPLLLTKSKGGYLSKQLSNCETSRDIAWERRRQQILRQERGRNGIFVANNNGLTDEDLCELRGCIELGFRFDEEQGQKLCNTLPALDLYFAVNRQISSSPISSSHPPLVSSLPSFESELAWKICKPGENPQVVKTKLKHWAQAVACVVKQSY
ncbi:Ankyrin repeat family protein [Hibiscus syriacus]|uniref:Ankyrin repeat family protein n=1 Tax=Hibiscus syriacus TaxID=106335 RepID=A0A6A2YC01_HIBSY|nr:uncharacterized protein LOC120177368 [Hibiscus syriacus]KAE8668854.1 Ankyrin repeat family protein [Hibiscus syriacus]